MEPLTILIAVGVAVALFGFALAVVFIFLNTSRSIEHRLRIEHLEQRIEELRDTVTAIWDALYRRGKVAVLKDNLGTMNSPIVLHESSKQWFIRMAPELQSLRESLTRERVGQQLTDSELALAIEKNLGERILEEVCLPLKIDTLGCLHVAVEVAKHGVSALDPLLSPPVLPTPPVTLMFATLLAQGELFLPQEPKT